MKMTCDTKMFHKCRISNKGTPESANAITEDLVHACVVCRGRHLMKQRWTSQMQTQILVRLELRCSITVFDVFTCKWGEMTRQSLLSRESWSQSSALPSLGTFLSSTANKHKRTALLQLFGFITGITCPLWCHILAGFKMSCIILFYNTSLKPVKAVTPKVALYSFYFYCISDIWHNLGACSHAAGILCFQRDAVKELLPVKIVA